MKRRLAILALEILGLYALMFLGWYLYIVRHNPGAANAVGLAGLVYMLAWIFVHSREGHALIRRFRQ